MPYEVGEPRQETAALLMYLIPLAVFIAYGFSAIHRWVPGEPADSLLILAAKLAVFVAIPAGILVARFGYRRRDLTPMSSQTSHMLVFVGMAFVLIVFQSVAGRGWKDITEAHVPGVTLLFGMPLVFIWLMLEVGVVEEFFFRVLLQSRLSAAMRSELGGIVVMLLLFGLVHAPGLYLRTSATQEGPIGESIFADGSGLFHHNHIRCGILSGRFVGTHEEFPAPCSGSRRCGPAAQYAANAAGLSHSALTARVISRFDLRARASE